MKERGRRSGGREWEWREEGMFASLALGERWTPWEQFVCGHEIGALDKTGAPSPLA